MGWTLVVERDAHTLLKEMQPALTAGNTAVGERWHKEFLPRHFTLEAISRYGYQQRKGLGQQKFFPIKKAANQTAIATNRHGMKYFRYQTKDGRWHTSHGELGYEAQKLKKFGHHLPLVYGPSSGGELKKRLQGEVKITATRRGVTIRMRTPNWFKGKEGSGPDYVKEITAISRDEAEALQRTLKDTVAKYLANAREHREIR